MRKLSIDLSKTYFMMYYILVKSGNWIVAKREYILLGFVFLFLLALMAPVQHKKSFGRQEDTAFMFQLVDNIAFRGEPVSQMQTVTRYAILTERISSTVPEKLCIAPLAPPQVREKFYFQFHTNFILYLLAPLIWVVPTAILLPTVKTAAFLGMLVLVFLILRRKGVSVLAAGIFTILVTAHPAWSLSVYGQFYVDRFAVFFCLLFLYLLEAERLNRYLLFGSAILVMMISERAGITAGIFTLGYGVFYWKKHQERRITIFLVGGLMFIFGYGMLKIFIHHQFYDSFLPNSLEDLFINRLGREAFRDKLYVLFAINILLMGFLAGFEWRGFLLALGVMIPNMIGDVGGAEKTGWATHYHSLYFPFLIWASAMGFARIYGIGAGLGRRVGANALAIFVLVAMSGINKYSLKEQLYSRSRFHENAVIRTVEELEYYIGRQNISSFYRSVQSSVPENISLTMGEGMMPLLYPNREILYFPIGIDVADYALITMIWRENRIVGMAAAPSALGYEARKELNRCYFERMKRNGWDFDKAVKLSPWGLTLVKRNP